VPKQLPPFEEWTPPWKEDEFDAEKAARLIYNHLGEINTLKTANADLRTENQTQKAQVEEKAREGESEIETLRRENEQAKKKLTEAQAAVGEKLRLEVALEKGLTVKQARRLVGESKEDLLADADELLESFGGAKGNEPEGQSQEEEEPLPIGGPRSAVNPGSPNPFNGRVSTFEEDLAKVKRLGE